MSVCVSGTVGQADGTGVGRRLRRNIYIWSTDKCSCSMVFNCLGAGIWTPLNLLVGRFRTEAVMSSVEALFIGIATGIRLACRVSFVSAVVQQAQHYKRVSSFL